MVELILKGFLFLVNTLYNLILSPIISVITSLFPEVSTFFGYITSFMQYSLYYVVTARELLLFPRALLVILLDYFIIKYTIHVTLILVRFIINIYNKFKP